MGDGIGWEVADSYHIVGGGGGEGGQGVGMIS